MRDRLLRLEVRLTLKLCEELGSPRALTVYMLVKHAEWQQLLDLKVDPNHYRDAAAFADDALVTGVLQKNPRLPSGIDTVDAAVKRFLEAEEMCKETNARLAGLGSHPESLPDADILTAIVETQREIQRVLGGASPSHDDLAYAESQMRFGPGATSSVGGVVTLGRKFENKKLHLTKSLVTFYHSLLQHGWRCSAPGAQPEVVVASKMSVVPKNAKTGRVICIEPDLNIYVQLGIGRLLRWKLGVCGLNLDRQAEVNRRLAQEAWRTGLSTVDLSMASDTLAEEAVRLLLPPCWVDLLEVARTPSTSYDGKVLPLHKWSAMGNGYTFELETLVFWALARSVCKVLDLPTRGVSAFGDDIIVPIAARKLLDRTLNFLGFRVNVEKSFGEGLFHESCGADFFQGVAVRPIYFRGESNDWEESVYSLANQLRAWAGRQFPGNQFCDRRVLPAWVCCFTAVHPRSRHRVPEGFDGGFWSNLDEASPIVRRDGWGGYFFSRRIRPIRVTREFELGAYYGRLHSFQSRLEAQDALAHLAATVAHPSGESLRGQFARSQRRVGYSLEWPNLGPWV